MKLFNLCIIIASLGLGACASGGGSSGVAPVVAVAPQTSTPTDQRVAFDSWVDTYTGSNGEVTVAYNMTNYTTTGLPAKTDKFYIEDYGFFNTTITGTTNRTGGGIEGTSATNFIQSYNVLESDINGDGHMDYYMFHWAGDHVNDGFLPESNVFAWINDGEGHFTMDQSVFADGTPCFMGTGCANNESHTGILVDDFNGDGMDDIFQNQTFLLSNNGKLHNQTGFADDLFASCYDGCWAHDAASGDADGNGTTDIFLPIWDKSSDESEWQYGYLPWAMLLNDGAGNFTVNRNFPDVGSPYDSNFATTAVIADFNNDGFGDVAVGWQKPGEHTIANDVVNSAGAVFYNDGTNDWRNRIVALPANYFGANGLANDMQAFDFDGDGFIDIVLASTKHDPYYDGRYVQFFKNVDGTTWSDVSSTANPNTTYANGLNNGYWNGDGNLALVDFDHDGDMDIVDQVRGTYALINNGDGTFTLYDDFPQFNDRDKMFAVELDGKFWYDFIGGTKTTNGADTETLTFFQVLDPPSMSEMVNDIATKPQGYATTVFETKLLFDDIRRQSRGTSVFANVKEGSNILGFNKDFDNGLGFMIQKAEGSNNATAFTLDHQKDRWHTGFTYIENKLQAQNKTMWFGTGNADLEYTTMSQFVEYLAPIKKNMFTSVGFEISTTDVKGFTEQFSDYNVSVDGFTTNDAKVFADINYHMKSTLGYTLFTAGVDHYQSISKSTIKFADILKYDFKEEMTVGKISLQHNWKAFYIKGNFNTENLNSLELGFNLTF